MILPFSRFRFLTVCLAVAGLSFLLAGNALAVPPQPAVYWGLVTLNGADVPAGTPISSFVYAADGVTQILCGSTSTQVQGGRSVYSIAVNGDDEEVAGKDGAEEGDTVYFFVGSAIDGLLAAETGVWHEAATTNLNLTAQEITPTPTVTATPTSTSTPSSRRALLPLIYKANAGAGEYVLHTYQEGLDGYAGSADTYLDGWNPRTRYGASAQLVVSSYQVRSPMLQFDLADIPQTARIESARIELLVASRSNASALPVALHRVNRHWSEDDADYLTSNGSDWEVAGCAGPSDREPWSMATTELARSAWWYPWDVTALVRDWVSTPASNAGVVLVGSSESGQPQVEYAFHSSESAANQNRPRLTVGYWLPVQ